MKILTFTSLYPNAAHPGNGIFVENRLRHLLREEEVESRVIAPVPWFPFRHSSFGGYGRSARAPRRETRHGIDVVHPRYPVIPKIGMTLAPFLMARAARRAFQETMQNGYDFELIDAHFFYPDGVAAAMLGRRFGKPVVITARGTDINLYPRYPIVRKMITWAARQAAGIVTVCEALRTRLIELGVEGDRVETLRNGVDLDFFRCPPDGERLRRELGFGNRTLLSVGHLIDRKGHDIVIRALAGLENTDLVIIGEGEKRGELDDLARRIGVAGRVRFTGRLPQDELRDYYGAADALVLASSREGWANVLLEAMACGTPVIASAIWGTPEVVKSPESGRLMSERTPGALIAAYHALFDDCPEAMATRRYAEQFSWKETSRGQRALFGRILAG